MTMETNKIYHGNCLDVIKTFPDKSIDSVITSPPYWQLRDYQWDGQWGLEPTFQMYLENLWSLMDEIYRVLKDTGTVWINLGDSYSTQSGTNLAISKGKHKEQESTYLTNRGESGNLIKDKSLPSKCLLLIPHRFAIGCIDRGWIMRNDIVWAKRNGMPESVTDRFSKKHEYFFFMTKNEKYYFDLDAIRDKVENPGKPRAFAKKGNNDRNDTGRIYNPESITGKNPGSVSDFWDIPTQPSKDAHYATYNTKLIDKPIVAGCPIGGIILDPFCGTATTGCRAIDLQREFIGIEGSQSFVEIGNKKLQPYILQPQLF